MRKPPVVSGARPRPSRIELAGICAIAAAIIWFYVFMAVSHVAPGWKFSRVDSGYYNSAFRLCHHRVPTGLAAAVARTPPGRIARLAARGPQGRAGGGGVPRADAPCWG